MFPLKAPTGVYTVCGYKVPEHLFYEGMTDEDRRVTKQVGFTIAKRIAGKKGRHLGLVTFDTEQACRAAIDAHQAN